MSGITVRFTSRGIGATVLFLLLLFVSAVATGAAVDRPAADVVYYVSAATGSLDADCGSQAKPCRMIQQAVSKALDRVIDNDNPGTSWIKVAEGSYTGTDSAVMTVRSGWLALGEPWRDNVSVHLTGGYPEGDWSAPGRDASKTVIDGQNTRRGLYIESNGGSHLTLVMENVTIQNGYTNVKDKNAPWYQGGGLLCEENHDPKGKLAVTLTNVVFKNNVVQGNGLDGSNTIAKGGGANFERGCRATLTNTVFEGNKVYGGDFSGNAGRGGQAVGGGLYAGRDAEVNIKNVVLRNNIVVSGNGGTGRGWDAGGDGLPDALGAGAGFQFNTNVSIEGMTATGNRAEAGAGSDEGGIANGGALFFEGVSTASITDSNLSGNVVQGGGKWGNAVPRIGGLGAGGALQIDKTNVTLNRVTVVNNQALGGRGSESSNAGGGGIAVIEDSTVVGTNLLLADNKAEAGETNDNIQRYGAGGGMFIQSARVELTHATIVNNSVLDSMPSPAIDVQHFPDNTSSKLVLRYSIVANHTHRWANAISVHRAGDTATFDYVLFDNETQRDYGNFGNGVPSLNASNLLSGNPGFVNPSAFDYRLTAGSAAIDKAAGSNVNVDLEGQARPNNNIADIGMDEYRGMTVEKVIPGDTTLSVVWHADLGLMPDLASFAVIYQIGTAPAQVVTVGKSVREYTIVGLANYTKYSIWVEARDASGASISASETKAATPTDLYVYLPALLR